MARRGEAGARRGAEGPGAGAVGPGSRVRSPRRPPLPHVTLVQSRDPLELEEPGSGPGLPVPHPDLGRVVSPFSNLGSLV